MALAQKIWRRRNNLNGLNFFFWGCGIVGRNQHSSVLEFPLIQVAPDQRSHQNEQAESGNSAGLAAFLADDVVLVSDGGGKRAAALNPIRGADHVIRLFEGLTRKAPPGEFRLRAAPINGMPGFVVAEPGGGVQTIALDIENGKISAIYLVRNPDKLRGVAF